MKKSIITVVFVVFAIWAFAICNYVANHYTAEATCIEVTANTIAFNDGYNIWEVYNTHEQEVHVGDRVKLTMYTNTTDLDIYDDVVEGWEVR